MPNDFAIWVQFWPSSSGKELAKFWWMKTVYDFQNWIWLHLCQGRQHPTLVTHANIDSKMLMLCRQEFALRALPPMTRVQSPSGLLLLEQDEFIRGWCFPM